MRLPLIFAVSILGTHSFAAEPDAKLEPIRKDLYYLAGDDLQGRGLETKGIVQAGDYIAKSFKNSGLKPGGSQGYFQPFEVAGKASLGTPNTLTLDGPLDKKRTLVYDKNLTPVAMSGSGKTNAGLAFVGYGITSKQKPKYDDYANIDVKGKLVFILRRTPRYGQDNDPFEGSAQFAALTSKIDNAIDHGAVGVIFVNDETENDDALMPFGYARGTTYKIPVLHVKRGVLNTLLQTRKTTLKQVEQSIDKTLLPNSIVFDDWKANAVINIDQNPLKTRNVIGVVEGSGPLADETIVIGAHYDHLGKGERGSLAGQSGQGEIHHGADDNASGTTGLLELARRFAAMKNRVGRRIVFIAFSGEERGLLGSKHYVEHPTFPLDQTSFMLNMDMIGRVEKIDDDESKTEKDRLVVYGTGTAEGLNTIVSETNRRTNFKLLRIPGGTGPSDHDSFYRKKIPVLFFFTGTHRDYHRPSDTADKINYEGLNKVVDLAEDIVSYYATQPEPPKYIAVKGGWSDPTSQQPQVTRGNAPKLGIMPGNYEATDGGVLVDATTPGGAAEKAGIEAKDVIIQIAGQPVRNIQTYMTVMAAQKVDKEIDVIVLRKDKKVTVKVTPMK